MEQLAVARRRDAQAGRGDPRPARARRAALPRRCTRSRAASSSASPSARCSPPHPRVLVLDEPTSALDPTAAEEVLAAITRLVHDLGRHRRARRAPARAGRAVRRPGDPPPRRRHASPTARPPTMFATTRGRAARRRARPARRLGTAAAVRPRRPPASRHRCASGSAADLARPAARPRLAPASRSCGARDVVVRYGDVVAVRGVDLDLAAGEVTALMGRNGSGKSSLLWAIQGSGKRQGGPGRRSTARTRVALGARRPARLVGLVPQTPADLLYLETVGAELDAGRPRVRTPTRLRRPASCSTGSRPASPTTSTRATCPRASGSRSCSPSSCAPPRPSCCSTSRPAASTTTAKRAAHRASSTTSPAEGRAVVISTHDVEFVARAADRVVVMADGDIVADGPTADVVVASPAFAPQVAKILAPLDVPHRRPGRRPRSTRRPADGARSSACRDRRQSARHRDPAARAARSSPRPSRRVIGFVCFLWPFLLDAGTVRQPPTPPPLMFGVLLLLVARGRVRRDRRRRHRLQGARDARRAVRGQRRAAPARRGHGRHRDGVLHAGVRRPGVRPGLRVRARLHVAVRLGDHHRRCRTVDALPDVRLRLGRPVRRPAAAAAAARREIAMLAAYGVLAGYFFGFMLNLQFWPFSVDPGSSIAYLPGRLVRRAVAPLPPLRRDDVARLGHRPGDHRPHLHRAARSGGARHASAGPPAEPPSRRR